MSAATLLQDLENRGVGLDLIGTDLRITAAAPLAAETVRLIRAAKPGLVRLLRDRLIARWLFDNPLTPSEPDRCVACGAPLGRIGPDGVPVLAKDGHAWVHHGCHDLLRRKRRKAAAEALGFPRSPDAEVA